MVFGDNSAVIPPLHGPSHYSGSGRFATLAAIRRALHRAWVVWPLIAVVRPAFKGQHRAY
jgi:hypothetical protein